MKTNQAIGVGVLSSPLLAEAEIAGQRRRGSFASDILLRKAGHALTQIRVRVYYALHAQPLNQTIIVRLPRERP
jgi:hypothetical protein